MACSPSDASSIATVYAFTVPIGKFPATSVIDVDNALWGVATNGGAGAGGGGTVFRVPLNGSAATALSFYGSSQQQKRASGPYYGLTKRADSFYGVTVGGGENTAGTIFHVTVDGKKEIIYSFPVFSKPSSQLTNVNGILYGTTASASTENVDTVYMISHDNHVSTLYAFPNPVQGHLPQHPNGRLLFKDGLLYGTTSFGGADSVGSVYSLSLKGRAKILYSFKKK